jgi:ribonuclease HI
MLTMTTDGGANPNPGPAGWGVLIRQTGEFICLWKHYEKASNNVMELSDLGHDRFAVCTERDQ